MRTPVIMIVYAAFLAACGFAAFALAGFASNARTALIVGFGAAAVMVICALLAGMAGKNEGAGRRVGGMIGIHAGLILPLIFAGLFAWRAYQAYADPAKLYLAVILAIMALGSAIVFGLLLSAQPKAAMRA